MSGEDGIMEAAAVEDLDELEFLKVAAELTTLRAEAEVNAAARKEKRRLAVRLARRVVVDASLTDEEVVAAAYKKASPRLRKTA